MLSHNLLVLRTRTIVKIESADIFILLTQPLLHLPLALAPRVLSASKSSSGLSSSPFFGHGAWQGIFDGGSHLARRCRRNLSVGGRGGDGDESTGGERGRRVVVVVVVVVVVGGGVNRKQAEACRFGISQRAMTRTHDVHQLHFVQLAAYEGPSPSEPQARRPGCWRIQSGAETRRMARRPRLARRPGRALRPTS